MGKNLLLWAGAIGFLVYTLAKQANRITMGNPVVSSLKLAGNGIEIKIKIPVLNRSDFTAEIQGFLGILKYKENILGNIVLAQPAPLPARATAEPEFKITIGYGSVLTEVWDFLQAKLSLFGGTPGTPNPIDWKQFRVIGTLWVSGVAVDLDEPIMG